MAANPTGGMSMVRGVEEIEQAIFLVLSTTPGERPMRPEFGCGLVDFVFAPMEPAVFGEISFLVETALDRWEPRIEVTEVVVEPDPHRAAVLLIEVGYRIRDNYDRRSLVFPFYVIPQHEEMAS